MGREAAPAAVRRTLAYESSRRASLEAAIGSANAGALPEFNRINPKV
jgi:hypothetical protein